MYWDKCCVIVPQNIHAGVSGNDSIIATGVFSAQELLRITRRESDGFAARSYLDMCNVYSLTDSLSCTSVF